jgi:hypothetical protein
VRREEEKKVKKDVKFLDVIPPETVLPWRSLEVNKGSKVKSADAVFAACRA